MTAMIVDLDALASPAFRVYQPEECGRDGYPHAWHDVCHNVPLVLPDGTARIVAGLKHFVRTAWGNRCERCQHPYMQGVSDPEWSRCDERCTHTGPLRITLPTGPLLIGEHGDVRGWDVDRVPVEAKRRVLTVHHLTGDWARTADAKRDCRWWNLAALCQRCHLTIQGKVQMERAFIFEHSPWFKIHAAGWYAWKYEGRDITPAEAVERQDELLGLERLA